MNNISELDPVSLLLDTLIRLDNSCGATTCATEENWKSVWDKHSAVKASLWPPRAQDRPKLIANALAFLCQKGADRQRAETWTVAAGVLIDQLFGWNPVPPSWRDADPSKEFQAPERRRRHQEMCAEAAERHRWLCRTAFDQVLRVRQQLLLLAGGVGVSLTIPDTSEKQEPRPAATEEPVAGAQLSASAADPDPLIVQAAAPSQTAPASVPPPDTAAFISAKKCLALASGSGIDLTHKQLVALLEKHPKVRKHKPNKQRLAVHAGDFDSLLEEVRPSKADPLDLPPETVEAAVREVQERQAAERARKTGK